MSKPETVGRNKIVSMQYSLTNTDGVVFEVEIQAIRDATEKEIRLRKVIA